MANLTEQSKWEDGIYQWETTDPVQGGADGIDNVPTRQLANRTQFLKALCATLAPLLSPALSGKPTTPTPDLADSSQQIANTAFVQTLIKNAVASLVNSAPGALDTLNELAAALGNDASFATHMTNALALKAPLASPALTGTPTVPTATLDTNSTQAASTAFAWALLNKYGLGTNDLQDWTGDLNNLTTSGLWFAVTTANAPSSNSAAYFVIVLPNASGKYAVQLAIPQAAGYNELWMRTQNNGGWSAWARMLSSNLLGNRKGAVAYSTDTTLTVSQFGALVSYNGTAAATFTLPTPVGNGGNSFEIWNSSAVTLTLSIPESRFLGPEYTSTTTATLPPNECATVISDGSSYILTKSLKAPIASPTFTGTPRVPTPGLTDNSTQATNTNWVVGLLASLGLGAGIPNKGVFDLNNAGLGTLISVSGNESDAGTNHWPASEMASSTPVWWNVLTYGGDSRTTQIASYSFNQQDSTGKSVWAKTFVRSRHDSNWSAWREISFADKLGNRQSAPIYTGNTTLTVSQFGSVVSFNGSANGTFTLPSPVGSPGGSFEIWNNSAYTLSLVSPAGVFLGPTGNNSSTVNLLPNEVVTLTSDAYNYIMRSSVGAQTPAQFDSSTRLATMEAVQRALGNYQGTLYFNSNTTLNESQAGYAIQYFGNGDGTFTLPVGSKVRGGGCFTFYNQSGYVLTVATKGSDFLYDAPLLGTSNTSMQVPQGDSLIVVSRGNGEWDMVGGSATLPYAFGFRMNQMGACYVSNVSANTSLLKTDVGRAFNFSAAATLTLPLASSVASGKAVKLRSSVIGACVATSGSDLIYVGANSFKNLSFAVGDTLTVMSDNGGAWIAVDGSLIPQNLAELSLSGAPTAPTPAQFDNSTRIATTASVQRAIGNRQSAPVYNTISNTITASQFGSCITYYGTDNATFNLPSPVGIQGVSLEFWNNSAYTVSLVLPAGVFLGPQGSRQSTYTMVANEFVTLTSDSYNFLLRTTITGVTPAKWDNTTRLATTSYVESMLGNLPYLIVLNSSNTLANTQAGSIINFCGTDSNSSTITLPLASTVNLGGCYHIYNRGTVPVTITTTSGDFFTHYPLLGETTLSYTVYPGDDIRIMSRGTKEWNPIEGSALLPYSFGFRMNKLAAVDFINVSSARKLASTDTGLVLNFLAAVAVTLPSAAGVGAGKTFKFRSSVMGASVVAASNNTIALGNSVVSAVSFGNGDTLTLMSDGGSVWVAIDTTLLGTPIGTVSYYAASTPPSGWLKCNGAAISRTTYANLFAVIGTTYGTGDGSTTFNVPDLRGEFVRGWDDSRGVDSGRALGSSQQATEIFDRLDGSNMGYIHTVNGESSATNSGTFSATDVGGMSSSTSYKVRPRNVALLAMIKY